MLLSVVGVAVRTVASLQEGCRFRSGSLAGGGQFTCCIQVPPTVSGVGREEFVSCDGLLAWPGCVLASQAGE